MVHNFLTILILLIGLVGLVTLGFVVRPRPFRPHPAPSHLGDPAPLPADLPEPVRRHFVETIGETPPRIQTALVWGRGRANLRSVWVPLRFRGWYKPGEAFVRRMEITWYQRPVLRARDAWVDGHGEFELGDRDERGDWVDQGQLLAMWAEAVWMPSVFVHDPQIHWEPVDAETARLVVPFNGETESLLAHFDPLTGRMTHFSGMRYSEEEGEKEPWRVDLLAWKDYQGLMIPCQIDVARGESGSPWVYWTVDGIAFNVNVSDQLG